MNRPMAFDWTRFFALAVVLSLAVTGTAQAEWTHWRGPQQNGVAEGAQTVASWSKEGENLIWRDDFEGRSTPVIFDGRVCAMGRKGADVHRQAVVVCWDAENGERLWERSFTVRITNVPWTRVGWAGPAADSETGYLYVHTVDGRFMALDRDGKTVWHWNLAEDLGEQSGYGGRTHSPIIDEDRVVLGSITASWGPFTPPRHRYYAFDKRTGDIVWVANPALGLAGDINTQSTPIVLEANGRRLLVGGNADGWVHALDARTGAEVWRFHLSKRGLNASVAAHGTTVFAAHSEENVDTGTQGRVVAIDATGSGDVTKTHEKWRIDELGSGFPTPLVHDSTVYVPDNSANLHAIDIATGTERWSQSFGTVGKSAPVWADGKIYLTEVNGNVVIIEPGAESAKVIDEDHLEMPDGRYAEIYASPAVAYDRIYFTTEEGIYCIGDKNRAFQKTAPPKPTMAAKADADAKPAQVVLVPAEAQARAGDTIDFRVRTFDAHGKMIAEQPASNLMLAGLTGHANGNTVRFANDARNQAGLVKVKVGDLEASSRVRVTGPLPWTIDFNDIEIGSKPGHWRPVHKGASVQELDGEKVLLQPKAARNAPRAVIYLGDSSVTNFTIQADIQGNFKGRRYTDLGVMAHGYTLDLQGAHQRLQVRSWPPERRMATQVDYPWDMHVWYTIKMRVDVEKDGDGQKAVIRGKVWKRDEAEPSDWTITAEDPNPVLQGGPALYTFAPVPSYFDNVKVTSND